MRGWGRFTFTNSKRCGGFVVTELLLKIGNKGIVLHTDTCYYKLWLVPLPAANLGGHNSLEN